MDALLNPFITIGYQSKEYFCDREYELSALLEGVRNGVHTTLISGRRLGKSALVYRLFESLEQENIACIYVDIFACMHLKDFTETLALAVFNKFPEKKGLGKRFFDFLKGLRPVMTYDALNGSPEIHFEFSRPEEYEHTLRSIFLFLEEQPIKVLIAIDEFQQVACFPEKNTEAILRTIIQRLRNVGFIFSGSKKHLMIEIFCSAKRPFYSSTQILSLQEIPETMYKAFIRKLFEERKREIDEEAIDFILQWTLLHTYYTQLICNHVFARKEKHLTLALVKQVCDEELQQQQFTFMHYHTLLSPMQWRLLVAIAKEGQLSAPQSQEFLKRHGLTAASSVQKALTALLEKEMICTIDLPPSKTIYRVYDVFLLRWLERVF